MSPPPVPGMLKAEKASAPSVASFDVFDTCLTRRVIVPSEVFRLVAEAIAMDLKFASDADFEGEFIAMRMEAERRARRASPREEIFLEDIWRELARMVPRHLVSSLDPQRELAAEASVLGPVELTRRGIAGLRETGRRIIFVSDTYLPADFLRESLTQHGMMLPGDGLYASSEVGLVKRSGRLFEEVLRRENLSPARLEHCGDDPLADQEAPARLGIAIRPFSGSRRDRVEDILVRTVSAQAPHHLALAGELRFARLSQGPLEGIEAPRLLVETFLGPFACIMGQWALAQARAHGLHRLWFAARDARLLHLVCENLERSRERPIECRYLHVSRRALLLAASGEPTRENLHWLRRDFEQLSLQSIAPKLDLKREVLLAAWRAEVKVEDDLTRVLTSEDDWRHFWTLIEGPLAETIRDAIRRRRETAHRYLASAGLTDGQATAGYVDLGWFLTCQEALNRLVSGADGFAVRGLYMALRPTRRSPAEAGPAEALFRFDAADLPADADGSTLDNRETLLEHIVGLADHPTVLGYESDGRPLYAATLSGSDPARERFAQVSSPLLAYVRRHGRAWGGISDDPAECRSLLAGLLRSFFTDPPPPCARWLASLPSSKPEGGENTVATCSPYTLHEGWKALLPPSLSGVAEAPARPWPEAAFVLSPRATQLLLRLAPNARCIWRRLGL